MADQTESSIVIDAPVGRIMAVIADLETYPEWSEGITAVTVLTTEDGGRPLTARFNLASGPIKDTYELQYTWDGDLAVHWQLTTAEFLRAMDGSYVLTPLANGQTQVNYRLAVDVKMPMIGMIKRKAEKVIVDSALKGLKARAQS
ncbi:MAG: SRPBCC family protein [Actinomycetes bacterium]